jgi:peroxin-13
MGEMGAPVGGYGGMVSIGPMGGMSGMGGMSSVGSFGGYGGMGDIGTMGGMGAPPGGFMASMVAPMPSMPTTNDGFAPSLIHSTHAHTS